MGHRTYGGNERRPEVSALTREPPHIGRMDDMKTRSLALLATAAFALTGTQPVLAADKPTLLIKSVRAIDTARHTVVFPIHKGSANGKTVWYILTDASDAAQAKARGLVFAPLLANVGSTMAVKSAGGTWQFAAAPDFTPDRVFKPGPGGFPPAAAAPGAVAAAEYSPFVKVDGGSVVYNAPIVATGDGPFDVDTHRDTADRVLALDPKAGTVTLLLADGFAAGKHVFYISTEASDPGAATLERATYAPSIGTSPQSARLRIFALVNGRDQGFAYAALSGHLAESATTASSASLQTSRNILGGLPAAGPDGGIYDPLWDVSIGAWTKAAVDAGQNVQLTDTDAVQAAADKGRITAPDGKPFGRAGIAVNCPVVAVSL